MTTEEIYEQLRQPLIIEKTEALQKQLYNQASVKELVDCIKNNNESPYLICAVLGVMLRYNDDYMETYTPQELKEYKDCLYQLIKHTNIIY